MFKQLIDSILGKKEKNVNFYVDKIKKELASTREDNIKMWIPRDLSNSVETVLIDQIGYDFAFLRGDNEGNILVYISPVVNYNDIISKKERNVYSIETDVRRYDLK